MGDVLQFHNCFVVHVGVHYVYKGTNSITHQASITEIRCMDEFTQYLDKQIIA